MLGISLKETRFYLEAREDEARDMVIRQLGRRCGELSPELIERVPVLFLEQLEALGEDLLDFQSIANLESWLENLEPA